MREESVFLDTVPFATIKGLKATNLRSGGLTNSKTRAFGAPRPITLNGKPDKVEETVFEYSAHIPVAREFVKFKSANMTYDPMQHEIDQETRSLTRRICNDVINNTPILDPLGFVGLRYRMQHDLSSTQSIPASGTNGTALDLDHAGANYADNVVQFKIIMDKAKAQCAGKPTICLCNHDFIIYQNAIWAGSQYLKSTEDKLHRTFADWDGVKYVDMGYTFDDETFIIPSYENANGEVGTAGTDRCTSVYFITTGPEYWTMLQPAGMEVNGPREDDAKINYVTDIDWLLGQMITNKRSVTRVYGLKMF